MTIEVFVSYAHEDGIWFDKYDLIPYLKRALENLGVNFWWDEQIGAGARWEQKILDHIQRAHIALLLISREFMSSQFINEKELPLIMERAGRDELAVLPILVRPCPWQRLPVIKEWQMLPGGHGERTPLIRTVKEGDADWDEVREHIVQEMEKVVLELLGSAGTPPPETSTAPAPPAPAAPSTPAPPEPAAPSTPEPPAAPPAPPVSNVLLPSVPSQRPEIEEVEVAGWPPPGMFSADAGHVWRKAAGVAAADGDLLTSAHLCWALLSVEGPLAAWMRACGYPLEDARNLMALFVSGASAQEPGSAPVATTPDMSDTVEGVWRWAQEHRELHPISLQDLTAQFAAVQGRVSGELLSWLQVDLSDFPRIVRRLELAPEVEEVLRLAREAARWNGLQVTTTHLYLGILEQGRNMLCSFLASQGKSGAEEVARLRQRLLVGEPGPAAGEETRSMNVIRILSEAERQARARGGAAVAVDDLITAALALEAGAFGRALKEMGFDPAAAVVRAAPPPPPSLGRPAEEPGSGQVDIEADVARLVELATYCAHHVGHGVIGTPHILAAGLHEYEPLRRACEACGYRTSEIMGRVLQQLGLPAGVDAFAPVAGVLPLSGNTQEVVRRAQRECRGNPLSAHDLLLAILTHAGGKAALILQSGGFEPFLLSRELRR